MPCTNGAAALTDSNASESTNRAQAGTGAAAVEGHGRQRRELRPNDAAGFRPRSVAVSPGRGKRHHAEAAT